MKTKIYEVAVQVITTVTVPVKATDEDDAREKINYDIREYYGSQKHFLRENCHDFVNMSYIDDCEFWNVNDITEDILNGSSVYELEDVA